MPVPVSSLLRAQWTFTCIRFRSHENRLCQLLVWGGAVRCGLVRGVMRAYSGLMHTCFAFLIGIQCDGCVVPAEAQCRHHSDESAREPGHVCVHAVPRSCVCPRCAKVMCVSTQCQGHVCVHAVPRSCVCPRCAKVISVSTLCQGHVCLHAVPRSCVCPRCAKVMFVYTLCPGQHTIGTVDWFECSTADGVENIYSNTRGSNTHTHTPIYIYI